MWRQLPHHLHQAGLADDLADLLASPDYIVKKAAHFGHESLAIDRAALGRTSRPDNATWHTARVLTSGGRLLHGLTSERDMPATLLAAASRAGAPATVIGRLRDMAGARGFGVRWALSEGTDDRGHTGAVTTVATHGAALVSGGEDGPSGSGTSPEAGPPASAAGTQAGCTR